MKQHIHIKDLASQVGQEVTLYAFIQVLRDQSKIAFIILRDITGTIQAVVLKDCPDFEKVKELTTESYIKLTGLVKEEKQAPSGYEIETRAIEVISLADPELPIPVNTQKGGEETNPNARFDYRWLDLRKPEKARIFKTWTAFEKGMRTFYDEQNFMQLYSPAFMSTASETGAELFEVDYFEKKAYLSQSPQFYKQMALAAGFERVFIAGPVFRAELSFTTRHLTEFTGWDFEISNIDSHYDLMDMEEEMIVKGFERVAQDVPDAGVEVPTRPFPRLTMIEAKEKLQNAGITSDEAEDLSPEEERGIAKIIKEETGHDFVFVTDYHVSIRPFYHMRHEDNPERTKSADLLYRGIEITTLAQREHRVDILKKQATEKNMDLELLADYINFFKYGCPTHGGGGIGANRLIMKMLDLENVREATYLPRDVNRLTP